MKAVLGPCACKGCGTPVTYGAAPNGSWGKRVYGWFEANRRWHDCPNRKPRYVQMAVGQ